MSPPAFTVSRVAGSGVRQIEWLLYWLKEDSQIEHLSEAHLLERGLTVFWPGGVELESEIQRTSV